MSTIQQALKEARLQLANFTESSQSEALILLGHAYAKSKEFLIAHSDETLDIEIKNKYQNYIKRRLTGEPIAYITQTKEFWSLPLYVEQGVLIPRTDTELIIEATLEITNNEQHLDILDLGTGSGCIALALAKELPFSNVVACDNSKQALSIAQKNADKLQLSNVTFKLSDWFNSIEHKHFDIIVSNPPYIAHHDNNIETHVEKFEPRKALFSKDDGLADLSHIIKHSSKFLTPGGTLLLEHGFQQAHAVRAHLKAMRFSDIKTLRDIQQLERVTQATQR